MSQYANFYLRRGECFIPIGSFSRNNTIYDYVSGYTKEFEKVGPLTEQNLSNIISEIKIDLERIKKTKKNTKRKYMAILQSPITIEEKRSLLDEQDEVINSINEDKMCIEYAFNFFNNLADIVDNARYSEILDIDKFLYVGIETPENITEEDIFNGR